jgi:hypothetical protein
MTTRVAALLAAVAAVGAGTAGAAERSTLVEADALLVLGAAEDGPAGPSEAASARLSVFTETAWLFANGVEAAIGIALAAERDQSQGGVLPCPGSCGPGVRGLVSDIGLGRPGDDDADAAVEAAYLRLAGPWGEASLGRDQGVATRYARAPPGVLRGYTLTDARLRLGPTPAVRVLNDPTGPSAKLTVETPRLLGVKAGASFTPDEEASSLDDGFSDNPDVRRLRLRTVWEGGLSFSRTWSNGVRTTLGSSVAQGEVRAAPAGFESLTSAALSLEIERGAWTVGGAALRSDNGWQAGGRDHASAAVSARWSQGPWQASLGAARAEDDLLETGVETVQAELGRTLNDRLSVGLGLRQDRLEGGAGSDRRFGAIVEISLKL